MKRPRIERIPEGYAPRYPRTLDAQEYRDLIAPDAAGRAMAAAVAAGLAFAVPAAAQGGPKGRDQALVDLLNRTLGPAGGGWYEHTTFAAGRNAYDSPVVVPRIPISFGNSHNGVFDAGRARQLALQLFAVYGLQAKADQQLREDGVAARLDGWDAEHKVGFKLRGGVPEPNAMWAAPKPEPAEGDLDEAEHKLLAARGCRVHVADLKDYPLMDGDQLTPTVAYLAGIVDFLNAVTDGPDLSLDAILLQQLQRFPLPKSIELPAEVTGELTPQGGTLQCSGPALVVLRIDPRQGAEQRKPTRARFADEWQVLERPLPTAGQPTVVRVACTPTGEGARMSMRVDQQGRPALQVHAGGPTAFLPARFDATAPFTITLQLQKGSYMLGGHVLVGAKAP